MVNGIIPLAKAWLINEQLLTSIGVNDITHGTNSEKWIVQQSQIIRLLQLKFQTQHILLSSIPPMHLFPALPQPLRWFLGRRALQFNIALKKLAEGCEPCEFVAIDFPLDTTYMAADGFHPGALAYSLWANHLAAMIRGRLEATVKHSCPNASWQ